MSEIATFANWGGYEDSRPRGYYPFDPVNYTGPKWRIGAEFAEQLSKHGNWLSVTRQAPDEDELAFLGSTRKSTVYAIGDGMGMVKIGYSQNLPQRFVSLNTASPYPLVLLAYWFGGKVLEDYLHVTFADRRSHGEWFDFSGCEAIEEIGQAAWKMITNA